MDDTWEYLRNARVATWEYLRDAWSAYSKQEKRALQEAIAAVRRVQESSLASAHALQERAQTFAETGVAHTEATAARALASVSDAAATYPEGVVGGSTVLFATARGASNGSMLGRSPASAVLFAAAMTVYQRAGRR